MSVFEKKKWKNLRAGIFLLTILTGLCGMFLFLIGLNEYKKFEWLYRLIPDTNHAVRIGLVAFTLAFLVWILYVGFLEDWLKRKDEAKGVKMNFVSRVMLIGFLLLMTTSLADHRDYTITHEEVAKVLRVNPDKIKYVDRLDSPVHANILGAVMKFNTLVSYTDKHDRDSMAGLIRNKETGELEIVFIAERRHMKYLTIKWRVK